MTLKTGVTNLHLIFLAVRVGNENGYSFEPLLQGQ